MVHRHQDAGYSRVGQGDGEPVQADKMSWSPLWRCANLLVVVFFALSSFVQINDDNPYLWVPVYMFPALLCFALVFKPGVRGERWWQLLCGLHLGLTLVLALYKAAAIIELLAEQIHNPLVHMEGRELAGLSIVAGWLSVCLFTTIGRHSKDGGCGLWVAMVTVGVLAVAPLALWSLCFVEGLAADLGHCTDMFPGLLSHAFPSNTATHLE